MRSPTRGPLNTPFPHNHTPGANHHAETLQLIAGVVAVLGIGFLFLAYRLWKPQQEFVRSTLPGVGTVIRHVKRYNQYLKQGRTRTSVTYAPVIRFKTSNGATREFTSSISTNPPDNKVGDSVSLVYDPRDPLKAEVNNFFYFWIWPITWGTIGLILFGISIIVYVFSKKMPSDL